MVMKTSEKFRDGVLHKCQKWICPGSKMSENDTEKGQKCQIFQNIRFRKCQIFKILNFSQTFWYIDIVVILWNFWTRVFFENINLLTFQSEVHGMGGSFSDGPRPKLISGQVKTDLSSRSSARKYWWGIGGKMAISWVKHAINNEL